MMVLTALQIRIIGVMLEKEITTPEQYPLSLNALTNGCNQKSNREPVMSLTESEVQNVVDELVELNQLMVDTGSSGRVNKYKHRFCNTNFGNLQLTEQEKAILCVLFLRGPQTPGELRTRTQRLAEFDNVNEVEAVLEKLQGLDAQPKVKKLPREAGKRESRYIHLFTDIEHDEENQMDLSKLSYLSEQSNSQDKLEARVAQLEQEVEDLKAQLSELSVLLQA
jgi:uncharacterized protein YceH (UPF0502 family)